ncbi:MAG TPA: SDR family oxidoreductase [Terriglobales bacterium]|nr:SDR family oxidoreductase [Terriglobales bacterium]
MSNSLQGRTAVVFGVANKRSIAWAIAQQMQQAGAQLAITHQPPALPTPPQAPWRDTRMAQE